MGFYDMSRKQQAELFELPPWVPLEAWNAFLENRQLLKAPLTSHGKALIIKRLAAFKAQGEDPKAVLEQSIEWSWRGIFSTKQRGNSEIGRKGIGDW
jgi:hypothetical protein